MLQLRNPENALPGVASTTLIQLARFNFRSVVKEYQSVAILDQTFDISINSAVAIANPDQYSLNPVV